MVNVACKLDREVNFQVYHTTKQLMKEGQKDYY
jgi:hypothetical protein